MSDSASRYIIGIDLGTTNSCLSYVDTEDPKLAIQLLRIPQVVSLGIVDRLTTLPSVCYLSSVKEWPDESVSLPWKKQTDKLVGTFAQAQGSKVPTKLIQSAKSWLCHFAANRRDRILPFESSEEDRKLSPLEATAEILLHLKEAWNHLMAKNSPEADFDQQSIILTVPASFDEVARRLTVESAKMAGYVNLTLLEEPQAAFYAWISANRDKWKSSLNAGDHILVCDVGGGTTDFSLISVEEKNDDFSFNRLSVGDHLLLGGDNMDAAIAHFIEQKIYNESGKTDLQSSQWLQLKHQARIVKEKFLDSKNSIKEQTILIQGSGSSVIRGSLSTIVHEEEIFNLLMHGFFGSYDLNDALKLKKSSAIRSMGLPYEEDPSITKQLAQFLFKSNFKRAPEKVLFNGGTMKALAFQQAILDALKKWFPESDPQILESVNLDTAVSRGAAYYGKVRRGLGVRIAGGIPKAYYLGVDVNDNQSVEHKALTLLPRGAEEGTVYEPEESFFLRPNQPVAFNIYSSQVRLEDISGQFLSIDEKELQLLPPIHTVLRMGKKQATDLIPVKLHIGLTSIGTLELWLQSLQTEHRWGLEFQVRSASGQENSVEDLKQARTDEIFDTSFLDPAKELIKQLFVDSSQSSKIMESLEKLVGKPKKDWSLSILRSFYDELIKVSDKRKLKPSLEERWWNMAGFCLRPGFGFPLDDFRIKELWKIILADAKHKKSQELLIQQWICFRRAAGGLNKGQQQQLANELLQNFLPAKNAKFVLKSKVEEYIYSEKLRTLASFELLEIPLKMKLGRFIIARLLKEDALPVDFWALGRLGTRHLLYGSLQNVIPVEECKEWIEALLKLSPSEKVARVLALLAKKSDHRELNISSQLFDQIVEKYRELENFLKNSQMLSIQEQESLFGEELPAGLVLIVV